MRALRAPTTPGRRTLARGQRERVGNTDGLWWAGTCWEQRRPGEGTHLQKTTGARHGRGGLGDGGNILEGMAGPAGQVSLIPRGPHTALFHSS